jgi:hypothetical protein
MKRGCWEELLGSGLRQVRAFHDRATSHQPFGKRTHSHPLAVRDPGFRNIALPDHIHAAANGAPSKLSATVKGKKAAKGLMKRLNQEFLWQGTVLTDLNHEVSQHFALLKNDVKYRTKRRMCSLQGAHLIEEIATKHGLHPRTLLVPKNGAVPPWVRQDKTEVVRVSDRVLHHVVDDGDGYVADYAIPPQPHLGELIASPNRLSSVLVLDNVADGGQLGMILRAATAFAYDAIFVTNQSADLYSHEVLRAAQGAHFQTSTVIMSLRDEDGDDVDGVLNYLQNRNELNPVLYSPQFSYDYCTKLLLQDGATSAPATASSSTTSSSTAPTKAPPVPISHTVQCLRDYCNDAFSDEKRKQNKRLVPGHMIIAGPDYRGNLVERYRNKLVRSPVTLLADSELDSVALKDTTAVALLRQNEESLNLALPQVLFALRHSAAFDWVSEADRSYADELKQSQGKADFGDHLAVDPDQLDMDDDEYYNESMKKLEMMRTKRLAKRLRSDKSTFLLHEKARINRIIDRQNLQDQSPTFARTGSLGSIGKEETRYPDVPHFINDNNPEDLLDRDTLRMERDKWEEEPTTDDPILPRRERSRKLYDEGWQL